MLRDRNIAFFIDVDNVGISSEHYANVLEQLNLMGSVLTGKVYGAGDRKHKEIYDDADLHGYKTERPMRIKRRGRKDFDARIFVDVVDAVNRAPAIDAVCIVAQGCDLVYLYSYLHARGIKIIALDNADEASNAFIDEVIDLGIVTELKLPKTKPTTKPAKENPAPFETVLVDDNTQAPSDGVDHTDELLKEIERLRELVSSSTEETEKAEPEQDLEPAVEEPAEEVVEEAEPAREKQAESVAEDDGDGEVEDELPSKGEKTAPRKAYVPTNDSDLIRRIEDLRHSNQGDDEDLIDEIRKLLDGLE